MTSREAKTFITPTGKGIYESGNKVLNTRSFYIRTRPSVMADI